MTDLAILVGLQGSGKSTFHRRHPAGTHVLVGKDLLRNNRRPVREVRPAPRDPPAGGSRTGGAREPQRVAPPPGNPVARSGRPHYLLP